MLATAMLGRLIHIPGTRHVRSASTMPSSPTIRTPDGLIQYLNAMRCELLECAPHARRAPPPELIQAVLERNPRYLPRIRAAIIALMIASLPSRSRRVYESELFAHAWGSRMQQCSTNADVVREYRLVYKSLTTENNILCIDILERKAVIIDATTQIKEPYRNQKLRLGRLSNDNFVLRVLQNLDETLMQRIIFALCYKMREFRKTDPSSIKGCGGGGGSEISPAEYKNMRRVYRQFLMTLVREFAMDGDGDEAEDQFVCEIDDQGNFTLHMDRKDDVQLLSKRDDDGDGESQGVTLPTFVKVVDYCEDEEEEDGNSDHDGEYGVYCIFDISEPHYALPPPQLLLTPSRTLKFAPIGSAPQTTPPPPPQQHRTKVLIQRFSRSKHAFMFKLILDAYIFNPANGKNIDLIAKQVLMYCQAFQQITPDLNRSLQHPSRTRQRRLEARARAMKFMRELDRRSEDQPGESGADSLWDVSQDPVVDEDDSAVPRIKMDISSFRRIVELCGSNCLKDFKKYILDNRATLDGIRQYGNIALRMYRI